MLKTEHLPSGGRNNLLLEITHERFKIFNTNLETDQPVLKIVSVELYYG